MNHQESTWWFIPLTKWVITPVGSGFTLLIPVISGVVTQLLSGMNHQVAFHHAHITADSDMKQAKCNDQQLRLRVE